MRLLRTNFPVGGGGYFQALLPLFFMRYALRQLRGSTPAVAMLYFHPWEFDPDQARLPLRRLSSFRTYVGLGNSREKLAPASVHKDICDGACRGRRSARSIEFPIELPDSVMMD